MSGLASSHCLKKAATPSSEVRLKASLWGSESGRTFKSVYIRGKSGDGPRDVRANGEIVQGFMRAIDSELEVAFLVPESRFLSFSLETSLVASSEVRVIVWPFEDLKSWNGESALLLREIEILVLSAKQ